jgi:hypothetical protein
LHLFWVERVLVPTFAERLLELRERISVGSRLAIYDDLIIG